MARGRPTVRGERVLAGSRGGSEPELASVVGGAEDEVADELYRGGDGRVAVAAEELVGELAERLLVERCWSHRVLDTEAPDVEEVDADGRAAAVAASAGDERGDQPAGVSSSPGSCHSGWCP